MDVELQHKCTQLDDVSYSSQLRIDLKCRLLFGASYAIRNTNGVTHIPDEHVDILADMAYLSRLSAFHFSTSPSCAASLQTMSPEYKAYFKSILRVASSLDTYAIRDLANDSDWKTWIDSLP
jgi:hypothetical protein